MVEVIQDFYEDRHDPGRLQIKLENEDESLVGEYTLTIKYGLNNHPNNPGVSLSFNVAVTEGSEEESDEDSSGSE